MQIFQYLLDIRQSKLGIGVGLLLGLQQGIGSLFIQYLKRFKGQMSGIVDQGGMTFVLTVLIMQTLLNGLTIGMQS